VNHEEVIAFINRESEAARVAGIVAAGLAAKLAGEHGVSPNFLADQLAQAAYSPAIRDAIAARLEAPDVHDGLRCAFAARAGEVSA